MWSRQCRPAWPASITSASADGAAPEPRSTVLLHLLAVFAIGFAAAGFVLLAYRLRGKRAPGVAFLTAAGAAMLGYGIWSEYTWFSRTRSALPDAVVVIEDFKVRSPLQPWTYLLPRVSRFIAVDTRQLQTNPDLPGYVLTQLILVERFEPTRTVAQIIDCRDARATGVPPDADFTAAGLPADAQWRPLAVDGPLYSAVCSGGPRGG